MARRPLLFFLCWASYGTPVGAPRASSRGSGVALEVKKPTTPAFMAPHMQADQFLLISSPSEAKVVWTPLVNFQSPEGRAFPLIDSGLVTPKGLAFDKQNGHLYIADSGASKIFRYTVLITQEGGEAKLTTTGVRLTVAQGHPLEWVATDDAGNLFYTAPDKKNINKITTGVMEKLATGLFDAETLQVVSEKTLETQTATQQSKKMKEAKSNDTDTDTSPTDAPAEQPKIYSIYEAELNPHVALPGSIMVDGPDLYWTNQADGKASGTVVKGEVDPQPESESSSSGPAPYPALALTNDTDGAMGLAKTGTTLFWTANDTETEMGLVQGMPIGGGGVTNFVNTLAAPRGVAWDGDQTIYVADQAGGAVWSFPAGRMMSNAPITKTVDMTNAFGLALLSQEDPCFEKNTVSTLQVTNPDGVRQQTTEAQGAGDDGRYNFFSFLR